MSYSLLDIWHENGECSRGVMVKAMDYGIVVSSNTSCAITFTFGQIPLRKGMNRLYPPSNGLNRYHYSSSRKDGFTIKHPKSDSEKFIKKLEKITPWTNVVKLNKKGYHPLNVLIS